MANRVVPAVIPAWVKPAAIGLGILLLLAGTLFVVQRIYGKGEDAGKNKVINEVQKDTIEEIERARKEKERVKEDNRATPIDSVIDKL